MRAAQALTYASRARASERRPPGLLTSITAWLCGARLDRDLAAGVASWRSPLHAARALQITRRRERRRLARSLAILVAHAQLPHARFLRSGVVEPCRTQVREALPSISAIGQRLRGAGPLHATGVARLRILLSDGSGPCYRASHPAALRDALDVVFGWLDTEE
jgi:hypothetical protein